MSDYYEDQPPGRNPEAALLEQERERTRRRRVVAMVVLIALAILIGIPLAVAYIAALVHLFHAVAA